MKGKPKKDPRFKEYGVDFIVDGRGNLVIMTPGNEIGVEILDNGKKETLVTNFRILGNSQSNGIEKLKYKLLLKIIKILFSDVFGRVK